MRMIWLKLCLDLPKGSGDTKQFRAVEDCWLPPTPPSPELLDQEEENKGEINKLEHNHALLEM